MKLLYNIPSEIARVNLPKATASAAAIFGSLCQTQISAPLLLHFFYPRVRIVFTI